MSQKESKMTINEYIERLKKEKKHYLALCLMYVHSFLAWEKNRRNVATDHPLTYGSAEGAD